ncbi:tubulin epsilon and delta complex protein 1 isoform X4 [Siniperca chuatsi]|uniref:tubulin epsilon and delta complex protein 1 isoform X4 n=1 Tax=Siniperca chuatsi TaxID=119488 RepID=UPI001CE14C2C|nr:tubulin epsilon and delta complex protein 1 isoform X4 [Siniperca chuatsi]
MQQRSKAAVSVEVKQVIGTLCRLLAAVGLEAVPAPETFRRAKFGGGLEVEEQFWQLLANILQAAGIVSCEAGAQLGGASEHRKLLAAGLWQTGYHADWMCGSDRVEGGRFSSRHLLLALGWLLATGTLEKLLTQRVQQLDKTLLTTTPNPQISNELQLDSASLRKLQWLIGCLRYQGRTLQSMQEERTRLLHAVFFACLSSSVSSEQRSTVLREDCVRMRQLCDLLELYLNWKQVEKVFWTWMKGQSRGRGDAEDRGRRGERLQGGSDTSSFPPRLFSLPFVPSLPQVYRARLQTERPVRNSSHPAKGLCGGAEAPDELPASQAEQLLLQTEALLLDRRDRQRLANRMQLQEMVGRLDELVLIPP